MNSATTNVLRKAAGTALAAMRRLADILDARPLVCVALLFLATIPYIVIKAYLSHLTCDEVYTLRIAQMPSIQRMIAVSRLIDLHPPLHFLAERAALKVPWPQLIAARLPSLLATLGTLTFLFLFASRKRKALPGFVVATLFFFSPSMEFAWSNRPYALWLCLLACSAWLWKRSGESSNAFWPVALFFSSFAMVADYMAGLPCIVALLFAEFVRSYRTRTINYRIGIALLLPCAAAVIYLHQITSFATNSFAPLYLDWFGTSQDMYAQLVAIPALVVIACALTAALLIKAVAAAPSQDLSSENLSSHLSTADLALGIALFALPGAFAILAGIRHTQFFNRYGACGAVGFAIVLTWCLERWSKHSRVAAALAAVALLITGAVQINNATFVVEAPWRAEIATGVAPRHLDQLDPSIPLVVARPTVYTEMTAREPDALLAHTYYVTDRASALKYSGSTVFENEAVTAALLGYKSRTEALAPFLAEHQKFFLVASYTDVEEWLPRALMDNGAHLQYLGKFASYYRDDDLYLVTTR